jgi:hypothetical protein
MAITPALWASQRQKAQSLGGAGVRARVTGGGRQDAAVCACGRGAGSASCDFKEIRTATNRQQPPSQVTEQPITDTHAQQRPLGRDTRERATTVSTLSSRGTLRLSGPCTSRGRSGGPSAPSRSTRLSAQGGMCPTRARHAWAGGWGEGWQLARGVHTHIYTHTHTYTHIHTNLHNPHTALCAHRARGT